MNELNFSCLLNFCYCHFPQRLTDQTRPADVLFWATPSVSEKVFILITHQTFHVLILHNQIGVLWTHLGTWPPGTACLRGWCSTATALPWTEGVHASRSPPPPSPPFVGYVVNFIHFVTFWMSACHGYLRQWPLFWVFGKISLYIWKTYSFACALWVK